MARRSEVGQLLHEEHFRFLVAVCGLQNRIGEAFRDRPLDPANPEERRQLDELIAGLDEVIDHHRFEETRLFPLIQAQGDAELVATLAGEHVTIEPKASRLSAIATDLRQRGPSPERWAEFCRAADALITDMMAHLQREELRVVQRLPSLLDAKTDHALAASRTARRQSGAASTPHPPRP